MKLNRYGFYAGSDVFIADSSQIAKYFSGIGTNKMPLNKFNDGITGKGCEEQIQEVYSVSRPIS